MPKHNKYFNLLKYFLEDNESKMKPDHNSLPFQDMVEFSTYEINRHIEEARKHLSSEEFQDFITPLMVLIKKVRQTQQDLDDDLDEELGEKYIPLVESLTAMKLLEDGQVVMARVVDNVSHEYKQLGLTAGRTVALQHIANMGGHYMVYVGGKVQVGLHGDIFEVDKLSF